MGLFNEIRNYTSHVVPIHLTLKDRNSILCFWLISELLIKFRRSSTLFTFHLSLSFSFLFDWGYCVSIIIMHFAIKNTWIVRHIFFVLHLIILCYKLIAVFALFSFFFFIFLLIWRQISSLLITKFHWLLVVCSWYILLCFYFLYFIFFIFLLIWF